MMIHSVRHDWPEKAGFLLSRPQGLAYYTFLHFTNAATFRINGEAVTSRPGACIFYAPTVPQWFHSEQELIHNWIHVDPSLSDLLTRYEIPQNCLLYPENPAFISELFYEIELEYFSDHPYKQELMNAYVKEFVIKFSRALKKELPPTLPPKDSDKLREARRSILARPEEKWTVATMAALVSLSPSRFHAVYKAQFGTSPMHDVIDAKIRHAKSLLLSDSNPTVLSVAESLGYNDQYHFIRQFKTVTGETPAAYRRSRKSFR